MNGISWISVELPWRNSDSPEQREATRLSNEYTAWFAATISCRFGTKPRIDWDGTRVAHVLGSCPELADTDWGSAAAFDAFITTHNDPDVLAVARRRRWLALCTQYELNNAECQEWIHRIGAATVLARSRRFSEHEMCRAGVALEIRASSGALRRVIIGDVGPDGYSLSVPQIADDDVVVRYLDLRSIVRHMEHAP